MEIKDMTNVQLLREEEFVERQIKNLMSIQKQIKEERSKRFDKGELSDGNIKKEN